MSPFMTVVLKFRNLALPLALAAIGIGSSTRVQAAPRDIYPAPEQAPADLAAGLKTAAAQHKRVILDFGGNWCGDCQVLDIYFHDPANKPLLDANYVLIHINIGLHGIDPDTNRKIAERYQVPLDKGVPALAVLDQHGKLIMSQRTGEFESIRHLESSAVTSFLVQWKPSKAGM